MLIPLAEVPSRSMGGGEERHYFLFYERNPDLPVEVVITRLPPFFGGEKNWHNHSFLAEYTVPLSGEIVIKEKKDGKLESRRHLSDAILSSGEWVVGIECENDTEAKLLLDSPAGNRRELVIHFDEKFAEGKNMHTVENPTDAMVTMITMKRVPKAILAKDPLVFRADRSPGFESK